MAESTGVKPPKATYEEALANFAKAEELSPGYNVMNLYMLGKVHHRMKNDAMAIKYLEQASTYNVLKSDEDHEAHKKSKKLLSKLGNEK